MNWPIALFGSRALAAPQRRSAAASPARPDQWQRFWSSLNPHKHDHTSYPGPAAPRNQVLSTSQVWCFAEDIAPQIMWIVEQANRGILIVDHNPLLLEGLCTLVRLQPDMEVVGTAASASEAVRVFREHRPRVVLMDLDLPVVS